MKQTNYQVYQGNPEPNISPKKTVHHLHIQPADKRFYFLFLNSKLKATMYEI